MSQINEQDELSGKKFTGRILPRLLPYLRPQLALFLFCLVLVFAATGIALYTPLLLGKIVDKALIPRDFTKLWHLVALYALLEFGRIFLLFAQAILLQRVGQKVMHGIRSDLFGHLIRMPVPFFDQNPAGRLVTRVTNDTANLSELFNAGFISFLADISLIVGVLAIMVAVHWRLGLLALSAFPFMLVCMFYFSRRLRSAFRGSRRSLAMLNGYFAERAGGMPIVQMMGREEYERERYSALSKEFRLRQFDSVYIYSLFHPTITILSGISMVCVIYFGAPIVSTGEIALGTFVAFLAYVQNLYQPIRSITDKYNIYLAAMASAERIFALVDMPEEEGLRCRTAIEHKPSMKGELEFRNVSFQYAARDTETTTRPQALIDVSFSLKAGEHVAVVGATGAGKSTLLSLLFRFYEVQNGKIILDGADLSSIDKHELRRRIGFVQQDVFIFSGTVRENLRLLAPEADDKKILSIATLTGFTTILSRMSDGLDTILDERGSNLSLGERQILSVTRTLLQEPEILVLDEATASVDSVSEKKIQEATQALIRGRTAIIIAHRLSTVQHVDRILVFHQGRLTELGSHAELLAKNSQYAKLIQAQSL